MLPRPDLFSLGISYRRIPLLSLGRDVYADSRLILSVLETHFPDSPERPTLGARTPEHKAIETLLEKWCVEAGVFTRAAQLIPTDSPVLKDEKFKRDREQYTGRSWKKEDMDAVRPEALADMRTAFENLEEGLLADGRDWVLGTQNPSLADIEAIWPFHWLTTMNGALPPHLISPQQFPKVFAWIDRFNAAINATKSKGPKPVTLKSEQAIKTVASSEFVVSGVEKKPVVDESDPLGLKAGQEVEVWPTDTGMRNHDKGILVGLDRRETVVEVQGEKSEGKIRMHFPRGGFRVKTIGSAAKL